MRSGLVRKSSITMLLVIGSIFVNSPAAAASTEAFDAVPLNAPSEGSRPEEVVPFSSLVGTAVPEASDLAATSQTAVCTSEFLKVRLMIDGDNQEDCVGVPFIANDVLAESSIHLTQTGGIAFDLTGTVLAAGADHRIGISLASLDVNVGVLFRGGAGSSFALTVSYEYASLALVNYALGSQIPCNFSGSVALEQTQGVGQVISIIYSQGERISFSEKLYVNAYLDDIAVASVNAGTGPISIPYRFNSCQTWDGLEKAILELPAIPEIVERVNADADGVIVDSIGVPDALRISFREDIDGWDGVVSVESSPEMFADISGRAGPGDIAGTIRGVDRILFQWRTAEYFAGVHANNKLLQGSEVTWTLEGVSVDLDVFIPVYGVDRVRFESNVLNDHTVPQGLGYPHGVPRDYLVDSTHVDYPCRADIAGPSWAEFGFWMCGLQGPGFSPCEVVYDDAGVLLLYPYAPCLPLSANVPDLVRTPQVGLDIVCFYTGECLQAPA